MSAIRQILSMQMLKNDHAKLHAEATGEFEHLEIQAIRTEIYRLALENVKRALTNGTPSATWLLWIIDEALK